MIEFARSHLGWEDAHSTEVDERSTHPVVVFMPEINHLQTGGTMRLGARATVIAPLQTPVQPSNPTTSTNHAATTSEKSVQKDEAGDSDGSEGSGSRSLAAEVYGLSA